MWYPLRTLQHYNHLLVVRCLMWDFQQLIIAKDI